MLGHGQGVWGPKSPSGVQGQSPGRDPGRSPPEAKAKCEITVQLQRFPVENLGFNAYRSRAWTVYFANTIKKIQKIQWGEFERPFWVRRWAYL